MFESFTTSTRELRQDFEEAWVGNIDATRVFDDGGTLCDQTGDGKAHGDSVIVRGFDVRSFERGPAFDGEPILLFVDLNSHGPQIATDHRQSIRLLDPELAGVTQSAGALGDTCKH